MVALGLVGCRAELSAQPAEPDGSGGGGVGGAGGEAAGQGGFGGEAGGHGGTGGSGGVPSGPDAQILTEGDSGKYLLVGTMMTPGGVVEGELLIEGDLITCVAASCSDEPGAADAWVIATSGIIMPGMIDTHNHILFDIFDEDDWLPSKAYDNHNQWPNEERYGAMLDTKQYLNGESGSPVNVNCEMNKYGELKALVAGTTSVVGAGNPANKACYRTLTRTIDQSANGLCGTNPPKSCEDHVQIHTLFPTGSSANGVCANFDDGDTTAYLVHVGEGVNESALNEFDNLFTVSTEDGCLYDERTVIVHGTAFGDEQFTVMAENGMNLVWSPRSNVSLYGGGTDLSMTTDVPLALSKGITVALAPDWSMGGGPTLLHELRFADIVDNDQWGNILDAEMLTDMVTVNAAVVLDVADQLGKLEVGFKADVTVFGGDRSDPYASLLQAQPRDIRLVFVDGVPLYGDDQLAAMAPPSPGCEEIDVCGRAKFLCVARDGGDATNKFGQTYAQIVFALESELEAYDAMNLSGWDFAPIAPLAVCD